MKSRIKKIILPLLLIGETNTTTTVFDYNALTNIVVAVIPLFVLIAVIKLLFKSFKDIA